MTLKLSITAALTLALAAFLAGCGDSQPQGGIDPMQDPEFRAQLKERRMQRGRQQAERLQLAEELEAELAKDASSERVKDLQEKLQASEAEAAEDRRETYRLVRERLLNQDGGKQ